MSAVQSQSIGAVTGHADPTSSRANTILSANGYGKVVLQNHTCGARTLCAARSLVGVGVTAVLASLGLGAARAHRLALGGATNQAASAVQTGVRTGYVSFWQDQ